MEPVDIIVIAAIIVVVGGALAYIIKAKKSGKKCIGCPEGCSCSAKNEGGETDGSSCGSCCGCRSFEE